MTDNTSNDNAARDATPRRIWTAEDIRRLGAATTLSTAACILGIGRTMAYELAATNEFPVPLVRIGTRFVVPVRPLLRLLHLDEPASGPAAAGLDDRAASSVDASTRPADSPPRPRLVGGPEHPGGDT